MILHYVLEYHGKRTFDYMTVQLFPVCGGIFVKSFPLFYGERLTWFFTEEKPDGTVVSTVSKTLEPVSYTHLDKVQQKLKRAAHGNVKDAV